MNFPKKMDFATFVASQHAPTDEEWSDLSEAFVEEGMAVPERTACFFYADGFLIEHRADGFYPHAWWYSPVRHDTIEQAERSLHQWRQEWEE